MTEVENTTTPIEEAITMYAETVSPSRDFLVHILQQIPEQEERRAIRSPYRWRTVASVASVFAVIALLLPVVPSVVPQQRTSFYTIDEQVQRFEQRINAEDQAMLVAQYSLLLK